MQPSPEVRHASQVFPTRSAGSIVQYPDLQQACASQLAPGSAQLVLPPPSVQTWPNSAVVTQLLGAQQFWPVQLLPADRHAATRQVPPSQTPSQHSALVVHASPPGRQIQQWLVGSQTPWQHSASAVQALAAPVPEGVQPGVGVVSAQT